jgi:hypothetical protein
MAVTPKMTTKLWKDMDALKIKLDGYVDQKRVALENEEMREYPNGDRVARLVDQLETLETVFKHLTEACTALEAYE